MCKLFVLLRGKPTFVYSDGGNNMLLVQELLTTKEISNEVAWEQVKTAAAVCVAIWRFTPPQSQWRDGACKNAVKALKKT